MARAKNTSRSEARRRTRTQTRAEVEAQDEAEDAELESASTAPAAEPRRRAQLFKWPDVRADIKALPEMFLRTRRLLWVPFILLAVGFVLAMAFSALPTTIQQWALLYFQYFFAPQALFTYFIGGFLAPRGSYLIGLILGALTGVLWSVVLLVNSIAGTDLVNSTGDTLSTIGTVFIASIILGMFAAGFAGWYRDFLRGMQQRSRDRQNEKEQAARIKRRDERQEARRAAKQRPVS